MLPTGVVTLLLADIEGSTVLWETAPADMTASIARYDAMLDATIARHNGVRPVEQGEGDSFVAAFVRATDAVECALELQREMVSQSWLFRVRMALHTGEVQRRNEGNYIGTTINRCARLRAIAHGGQTVLSRPVHDLVVDHLPADASLDDMGVHRLRDLSNPEHVYQLRHPDLEVNPAPLRSLDVVPNNLPVELTSFIGRQREIGAVADLLRGNRMVTLLGTGGCGKTRLALQLAAQVTEEFLDGAWFVELAPIEDAALVPQAVAAAVGVREQAGRAVVETLEAAMQTRSMLLVLDNCEHVVSAAATLASRLLSACPSLTVLATTREALGVPGELTFSVPSLPLEDEAVELFADRAVKVRPGFEVTTDNAGAVLQICRQLDGIPLAIELAAARVRMLAPQQICDGLADRFRLLTSGARTLLPRQQTLRASVDWSYDLLADAERTALRRLSVFAGGFDVEAAETVVTLEPIAAFEVFDLLASLVDKSLVLADEHAGAVRYRMLETIRQYGTERLDEAGERSALLARHRDHYRELLRRAAAEEEGPDQAAWSARVRLELDNIRVALQSALDADDGEALIELSCGTGNTWTMVGGSSEHRRWLDESVARAPEDSPLRASALYQLGITDMFLGHMAAAKQRLGASVPLYRSMGDERGALWAYAEWAWVVAFEDGIAAARPIYDEGLALAVAADAEGPAYSMEYGLAYTLTLLGELGEARSRLEALLRRPAIVEHYGRWATGALATALALLGELREAARISAEVIDMAREQGDIVALAPATWTAGCARLWMGDIEGARPLLEESARVMREYQAYGMPVFFHGLALLKLVGGEPEAALPVIADGVSVWRESSAPMALLLEALVGDALIATGDRNGAKAALAESIPRARQWEAPAPLASMLIAAGRLACVEGRRDEAEGSIHEALAIMRPMGHKLGVVDGLEALACVAADDESFEEAARLFGAAGALRHDIEYRLRLPTQRGEYDAALAKIRAGLAAADVDRAWSEGAGLGWEAACDYAARGRGERKRPSTGWGALTPTEAKVVALVAEGLTNPQVGERLFISKHTVDTHLRHIFAKLGVSNRAELAAQAGRRDGADA